MLGGLSPSVSESESQSRILILVTSTLEVGEKSYLINNEKRSRALAFVPSGRRGALSDERGAAVRVSESSTATYIRVIKRVCAQCESCAVQAVVG
jgi:hypothetical protein